MIQPAGWRPVETRLGRDEDGRRSCLQIDRDELIGTQVVEVLGSLSPEPEERGRTARPEERAPVGAGRDLEVRADRGRTIQR